jgi:aspartate aminotransferase
MRWLLKAMTAVASETYTSTSAPIQYAAVRAFRGGIEIERYLAQVRRILGALCGWACSQLLAAGARVAEPHGAFYLFPDFSPLRDRLAVSGVRTSADLCEQILEETGVAILPGSSFGRPPEELTARLACVDFDGGRALAAAESVPLHEPLGEPFLTQYCGGVCTAILRLGQWMRDAPQ